MAILVMTLIICVALTGLCDFASPVWAQTKEIVQVGYFATGFDDLGNPLLIPSIDPAGITFHAPSGHLFIADSEINEVEPVFGVVGANIFEVSPAGDVLYNMYDTTVEGNNEPTGITYNEFDGYFYMTNDDSRMVYRYDYSEVSGFTIIDEVSTSTTAGATDPEGVTSDPSTGMIYVVDGIDELIVVYSYDEINSAFVLEDVLDLVALNGAANTPNDPEGIGFHVPTGNLFLVSDPDQAVYEFTTAGIYVRRYSIGAFTPLAVAPQGLTFGVTSDTGDNPSDLAMYIADGMIDNDQDPNERDGAIYEAVIVGEGITNERPVIDPIADQAVDEGVELTFTVTATDPDIPPDNLTFSVASSAPAGVSIDPTTGLFAWTPEEEYGAGVHTIDVIVTDDGLPPLSDSTGVTITVNEVNQPPVLDEIGDKTTQALTELAFLATASDPDVSPGSPPGLANGLIAYWSFDSDFSSGTGSNNGTPVNGAVITNTSGEFKLGGGALDLDGVNDYLSFGDISLPGDLTLSAWIDPENIDVTFSSGGVVFGDNSNADWIRIEADAVRAKWNNGTTVMTSEPDFTNGAWQHFLLVRSGTAVTVYRNGVVVAAGTKAESFTPEFLGWKNSGNHYGGRMDDVGVWGRALSYEEITTLYNGGLGLALADIGPTPANTLTFSLEGMVPTGAAIDPVTGAFTWTPTEAQAPDVYTFDVRVTDDGIPSFFDEETITVTVNERAIALNPIDDMTVNEEETLSFYATLVGEDTGNLTENLIAYWNFDANFDDVIGDHDGTGVGDAAITTSEVKLGAGALTLDGVGDYVDIGDLPLSGDFSVSLWVKPDAIQTGTAGGANGVLLGDLANTDWLRLQLEGITAKWSNVTTFLTTEPDFVNGPWQHFILVRSGSAITVYRNGIVAATGTKTDVFTPEYIGHKTSGGNFYQGIMDDLGIWSRALSLDEIATLYNGGDGHAIPIGSGHSATFSLDGTVPDGAGVVPETGLFTWTPTELQGPGVYDFTIRATDTVDPSLFDTESFAVTVVEINNAPQLDPIGDESIAEGSELTFTATATDPDLPANTLTFSLGAAPGGAIIDPASGVFTWTPTEIQGLGSWTIVVRVTDDGLPSLADEQLITVTVDEVNQPPVLDAVGDKTVIGETELTFTATASDPDLTPMLHEDLLAYWSFDSDFSSGTGRYDGTPINGALITNDPAEIKLGGGALKLDGVDDYMSFGDISLLTDFSVAVWFYPQTINVTSTSGGVVLGDGNNADWLRVETDGVRAKWNGNTTVFDTSPDFVNGSWQHFVLVRSAGVVTIYRNGSVVATGTKTNLFTPEYIGWKNSGNRFGGMLDDMGIWGRALDEDEVALLYNGGAGASVEENGATPANALAFALEGDVPAGAGIDPITGVFYWTPAAGQTPGSYTFDVRVVDDGTPSLSDSETITVTVIVDPNQPICDVSPAALDFGEVSEGNSLDMFFTIKNVGGGVLAGEVGEVCDHYSVISGLGPFSLESEDSLVVTVQFNPTAPGTLTCTVQTGTTSCGEVPCTGIGTGAVPVVLQNVDARWSGSDVEVSWVLLEGASNWTFDVAREEGNDGSFVRIQRPEIIEQGNQFTFHDRSTVPEQTYTYRIAILEGGAVAASFETSITTPALQFTLDQNRPNPFNPTTTVSFVLPREMDVNLSIYDAQGRRIVTLLNGKGSAGSKDVVWDGKDANGTPVSSGVYFYRLTAGNRTLTRKMVLLK
ncbi:MAG: putative Ig domain-containing protein [Candidatus Latescibacterota bacterium]|nr:MAG: putative Ig domain-containing protein [Candidatus Latescibacterota bacterium]